MTTAATLLPLFLGVPIIGSALAVLAPWFWARRTLVYAVPVGALVGALALIGHHRTTPVEAVSFGSYVPGVAIPFASDTFSALMLALCSLVAVLAIWLSDAGGELRRSRFFPALVLLLLGGVNGALLTADLFNLFVWVEVMLMPSYALLALTGGGRRIAAGRLFVVINLLTSTLLVAGVGLVYAVSGTVNLAALAGAAREDGRLAFALGLVVLALCIKSGVVPVHGWLPQTYPNTSAGVMALFAGLHTKVALYAVIRIWTTAFDLDPAWGWLMLAAALTTTLVGSIASASGSRIRGVLSWQMVSGVGVILASLAVGTTRVSGEVGPQLATSIVAVALTGAIVYMVHHMLTIGGLLSAFGALEYHYGRTRITGPGAMRGMWWRERWMSLVTVVLIASLIGLPLTSGLVAKFEVVRAGAEAGGWPGLTTLAVVCVGWFIGLIAMIRLWKHTMWDTEPADSDESIEELAGDAPEPEPEPGDAEDPPTPEAAEAPSRRLPLALTAPAVVFAAASIAMFVFYQPLATTVDHAVVGLIDTRDYVEALLGSDAVDGEFMVPPLEPDAEFRQLAGDDAAATVGAAGGGR